MYWKCILNRVKSEFPRSLEKASSFSTCGQFINTICMIHFSRHKRSKTLSNHQVLHRPEETNCHSKCRALFEATHEVCTT